MSRQQTVTATVLERRNWMESDRILTLLTREYGKMDVVARGARKAGSHLSASTEPFVFAEMHVAKGRAKNYLTQAQIHTTFPGIRKDYQRLTHALALSELYSAFTLQEQAVPKVFDLLIKSLSFLKDHPKPLVVLIWSALNLMQLEGVLPAWLHCNIKGTPLIEPVALVSPTAGGYVSQAAALQFFDRFEVRKEVLIGLSKIIECVAPPKNLKFSAESLSVLLAIWKNLTHMPFPIIKNILESSY